MSFLLLLLRSIAKKYLLTLPAVHYTPEETLTALTTSLHLRCYSWTQKLAIHEILCWLWSVINVPISLNINHAAVKETRVRDCAREKNANISSRNWPLTRGNLKQFVASLLTIIRHSVGWHEALCIFWIPSLRLIVLSHLWPFKCLNESQSCAMNMHFQSHFFFHAFPMLRRAVWKKAAKWMIKAPASTSPLGKTNLLISLNELFTHAMVE